MKHGWAFLAEITSAIEAWSGAVHARDPDAFVYRGADLRHAVERALFFAVANDAALMAYFDTMTDGTTRPALPSNVFHDMILPYLGKAPAPPAPPLPHVSWTRKLRSRLGNLSRLGRRPFRTARLKSCDFLFLAIHPKFVGFMGPLAQRLGGAFLSFNDPVVERHLEKTGLPCVALRPCHSSASVPDVLQHFVFLCRAFDEMTRMMEQLRPKVILVPEGNAPIHEIAHRAGLQHGVKTVCLQQGAPAYTNPGFRNWTYADVLVWGDAFVTPFARYNPSQHFSVTGTPAMLPTPQHQAGDAPVRGIGFFLQKAVMVIPAAEWDALLQLMRWTSKTWPDIDIIVRDHPTTPALTADERAMLGGGANIRFMPPPGFSLNQVMAASDVVVAAASTTLLEAVQAGAIPFVFGSAYPQDFPDIVGAGAGLPAANLDAAKAMLTRLVEDKDLRRTVREAGQAMRPHLFAASGEEGADRIAQALTAFGG